MAEILEETYTPKLSPSVAEAETARLHEFVLKNKILECDYKFYIPMIIGIYGAYVLTLYFVTLTSSYSLVVLLSIIFSMIAVQIAGLMHDASHLAMFKSYQMNHVFACIFAATVGGNYRHWIFKHKKHHDHPNHIGYDSDLEVPFSFTTDHYLAHTGYMKWIRRYQAWLYLPMCGFLMYSMQFQQNIIHLFKNRFHPLDVMISLANIFLWYIMPFLLFGPIKAIIFILIATFVTGIYLANIFATNHKAMPQLALGTQLSNLEQQIIVTRNVTPGILTDFIFLGLNYQIEHHIYRECPRSKFKLLVPYLKDLCERTGMPYTVESAWKSYKRIFTDLSQTAKKGQKILKGK